MPRQKWSELRDEHLAVLAVDPEGLALLEAERAQARQAAAKPGVPLATLRRLRDLTQQEVAGRLDVPQSNVSRIESQEDLFLSTLDGYVRALGGELVISAVFPDDQQRIVTARGRVHLSEPDPTSA